MQHNYIELRKESAIYPLLVQATVTIPSTVVLGEITKTAEIFGYSGQA